MYVDWTTTKLVAAVVLAIAFGGLMAGIRGATDLASICLVVGAAHVFCVRGVTLPRRIRR